MIQPMSMTPAQFVWFCIGLVGAVALLCLAGLLIWWLARITNDRF